MLQAIDGRDIVAAGCEAVACVEAETNLKVDTLFREFAQRAQFFEAAAKLSARADGILQKDLKVLAAETMRGLFDAFDNGTEPLLDRLALMVSRMHDEVFGPDRDGALDFSSER